MPRIIQITDETAGIMTVASFEEFEQHCIEYGLNDGGSDYPLLVKALWKGESFATKTTLYEWVTIA